MVNYFMNKFRKSKSLEDVLDPTKRLVIDGVMFTIKKINMIDYLNGSKVLLQFYDTYKLKRDKSKAVENINKVKEHYKDIIMAGVLSPKLSRKEDDDGFYIDKLLNNFDMCNKLYAEIIAFTYGKKKIKQLILQNLS